MNIGIFGGSFNPPHVGHLILGEFLCEELELDRMIFIPANISPHKEREDLIDAGIRFRLVTLAIKNNKRFEVSRIEIERGGISYTIDTLSDIKKIYSSSDIYLIVGSDNINGLKQWKSYNDIIKMCTVCVMTRPGFISKDVQPDLLDNVKLIEVPLLDISSSGIRKRIVEGKSIRYLVPDSVEKEINKNKLYRNSLLV